MLNTQLHQALILQGYSSDEASAEIQTMREQAIRGINPIDLLYENGLESDYVFDLFEF